MLLQWSAGKSTVCNGICHTLDQFVGYNDIKDTLVIESTFHIIQGVHSRITGLQNQPDQQYPSQTGCMLCSKMHQQKGRESTH